MYRCDCRHSGCQFCRCVLSRLLHWLGLVSFLSHSTASATCSGCSLTYLVIPWPLELPECSAQVMPLFRSCFQVFGPHVQWCEAAYWSPGCWIYAVQDNFFVLTAVLKDQYGVLMEEDNTARPKCVACRRNNITVTLHKVL
eukprot:GHUV01006819.1.p2 GENE.GHUV01006819.1~~GHUV01006819.1.p2  ORF type:complete len:141 (+),score=11.05 GHUV01006819.1:284-706(+)